MPDTAPIAFPAQRSHGRAFLELHADGRVAGLRQSGCAKIFVLQSHPTGHEAVFVNTAGGLTGGDTLNLQVALGSNTALACTTQAAERIYRSAGGAARVNAKLRLAQGASLAWLPQETILFDFSSLERRVEVEMAEDAELVLIEMLTLGRTAMGERTIRAALTDGRTIRRGGRLITHDVQRFALPLPHDSALLGDAIALATLIVVAPDAEARAAPLRNSLAADGVETAVSAWDGRLVARLLAPAPHRLRRVLAHGLSAIRGSALPRTWAIQQEAVS